MWAAGGIPLNLPVVSLGETLVRPTAMLWRNLAAMAIEEMLRANPIDGVVLLGGCDKTIPALLMAAASVDLPAVVVPGGPMLTGTFRGAAAGLRHRRLAAVGGGPGGHPDRGQDFTASESSMIRSKGHCNTMGTASTMACLAEALGMTLPGFAGTPAADSRLLEPRTRPAGWPSTCVERDRRPSAVLTRGPSTTRSSRWPPIGGSTNAVVHLLAIAGRLGRPAGPGRLRPDRPEVPLLVDLQPSGRLPDGRPLPGRRPARRARARSRDLLDPGRSR